MEIADSSNDAPLCYRVSRFCQKLDISKSTFWKYVRLGKIRVVRIGGRTLIPHSEALRLVRVGVDAE